MRSAVHFLELLLAGGVADTLGLLLTLIWTAGFLPGFLQGHSVAVLLAKPAPRWLLLVGKYVGVLLFVAGSAAIFVLGTWLAIGVRTGIWDAAYLYAIPLLVLHFAMFFSVSTCLAVWTHSTVVCVFGSIVFWGLAWSINYGRHALTATADALSTGTFSPSLSWLLDAGYWVLPKPADVNLLLFNTLGGTAISPGCSSSKRSSARLLVHDVDRHVAAVHRGSAGDVGAKIDRDRLLTSLGPHAGSRHSIRGCRINLVISHGQDSRSGNRLDIPRLTCSSVGASKNVPPA